MRLVECVPNFSEGRDHAVVDAIAAVVGEVDGAHLLDVDPGKDTNRTVVTFVAQYEVAVEAAFRVIEAASRLIDMSRHSGAHPRMGATDVCPIVPVAGVTMDDCVELARELGRRVGEELEIPVYLYEYAATNEERRNLANIRAGEYEGFTEKIKRPEWKPDFGPATFNAKSGATVIGAREFLIAYNVNLNTRDRKIAHDIALSVREAGRNKRDSAGKFVRDADGKRIKEPGTLKACKAVGWYIGEYNRAQVSINLVNARVTPPAIAFDEVKRQAELRGVRVTGSELVGLIPLDAILHAGRHYLTLQGKTTGVPESVLIDTAVQSLGLDDITPFDPQEKIIEYRVAAKTPLADGSLSDFIDSTSMDSPVPGGGSVSALMGALAAALGSMVASLTIGKKGYKDVDEEMKAAAVDAQTAKADLVRAVDDDSRAFDEVMSAMRLPKTSDEESRHRDDVIQTATKKAVDVPMSVLLRCRDLLDTVEVVGMKGNVNSASDAGVAARALYAAASGAMLNVLINLPGLSDRAFAAKAEKEATAVSDQVRKRCDKIFDDVVRRIRDS